MMRTLLAFLLRRLGPFGLKDVICEDTLAKWCGRTRIPIAHRLPCSVFVRARRTAENCLPAALKIGSSNCTRSA